MIWKVALAGALGAVCRYLLDAYVAERVESAFPFGTFVVNVTGSFALGLLTGLALYHGLSTTPKVVLGTGFVGAYTTFSTFAYETVRLFEDGSNFEALLNAGASACAGLLAAAAGLGAAAAL